jgi:hypothetical protein
MASMGEIEVPACGRRSADRWSEKRRAFGAENRRPSAGGLSARVRQFSAPQARQFSVAHPRQFSGAQRRQFSVPEARQFSVAQPRQFSAAPRRLLS